MGISDDVEAVQVFCFFTFGTLISRFGRLMSAIILADNSLNSATLNGAIEGNFLAARGTISRSG